MVCLGNRDHSVVFEIASKDCISDSFVDYDGYSTSSKGFLPTIIGILEVVKQEMARVNVNILGISKLRWTGMGEFNSDDHYIYHCGQESLRRNGVAIIINKRV